jgi:hypothetical protein
MSQGFVPFSTSAPGVRPAETGLRAKVVAGSKLVAAFRPITESSLPAGATPPAVQEPKVTLERDGSRVTRITVQCACGHTIELACE